MKKRLQKELLDEAQERVKQVEEDIWKDIEEYIVSWEPERRRSGTLNTNIWQMVRINKTKSEHLEHGINEVLEKTHLLGWNEGKKLARCWVEEEEEEGSS